LAAQEAAWPLLIFVIFANLPVFAFRGKADALLLQG
jgi:hypothetical protein